MKGDRYNKDLAALASGITPGLGQIIDGEFWRGTPFLVGHLGCLFLMGNSFYFFTTVEDTALQRKRTAPGLWMLLGAGTVDLVLRIWSFMDASKVAKVKNLYYRDISRGSGLSVKLSPSVVALPVDGQGNSMVECHLP